MSGPPPAREEMRVALEGGEIHVLRFGAAGAAPLLFAHANGFCASAYRRMFERLGDRFDIFAVDLRGHGLTRLPTDNPAHRGMELFGDDVAALMTRLQSDMRGARWRLAGHSLGGVAVTFAAVGRTDVEQIRLIEPVAMSRFYRLIAATPFWPRLAARTPLVRAAKGRRRRWASRDEVIASYARKAFFKAFAPGVLEDYLQDGLTEGAGGVTLSCTPEWEAANFAAQAHDFWRAVAAAPAPVSVLAARHPSTTVSTRAAKSFRRLGASVDIIDGPSHLIPFEAPDRAADFLLGD